jgi:hypothetical protein
MISKKILTPLLVTTLIFSSLTSLSVVHAQDDQNSHPNFFVSFFHSFMRKVGFEKNQSDTPPANITPPAGTPMPTPSGTPSKNIGGSMEEARLDQLVKDGKITTDQKTAILAEFQTLQNEFKTWAAAQGISIDDLTFQPAEPNQGVGARPGMENRHEPRLTPPSTPTPTPAS